MEGMEVKTSSSVVGLTDTNACGNYIWDCFLWLKDYDFFSLVELSLLGFICSDAMKGNDFITFSDVIFIIINVQIKLLEVNLISYVVINSCSV